MRDSKIFNPYNAAAIFEAIATACGERLAKRIPQRRVGAESDLDGAILLLASSASRYMTGSVVTVDGGFLLT